MIEVVGVLIAAGDGEQASPQDVGGAVRHQGSIARIGDQPCQPVGDPQASLGSRQQHDAAIGGDPATIKGRVSTAEIWFFRISRAVVSVLDEHIGWLSLFSESLSCPNTCCL